MENPVMRKKYFILFNLIIVFILVIEVSGIFSQDKSGDNQSKVQIQTLPKGVSIYQLDNGMQVLLIENPALPMVGVNVAVKVGSAYETFSTSGMSHMLEHLLFNGTTSRNQKQLYDDVDRIGGYNNAHTDLFYTDYMMVTPAENILSGMEIQADMLFNSTLPQEKFEKEKGIVLEEISKSLADPNEQLERNTISILFKGHALSLPTLGTYSTIKSLARDDVFAFYKNNYVPNNMILTVIGNFQTKDMLKSIKDIYGKAAPGMVKRDLIPGWSTGFQKMDITPLEEELIYNRFYDGKDFVLQLFYEIPQFESSKFSELLNLVLNKNNDDIQSSLKSEFPSGIKSVKLSARLSPVRNFVEADVILAQGPDYNSVAGSISKKLAALSFSLSNETIISEATKARTEFLRNIEKPHMFGIYNSNDLVISGIEAVLASYYSEEYYKAASELNTLKLTAQPVIIIQSPSVENETAVVGTSNVIKQFNNNPEGADIIAVQNDVSNLLAIHYLIKHKAFYESKYGKDAAKILHDCIEQRMESDANQKMSNQYGLTFVFNDNPFIPMDNIYLDPDFGYIRVEGLAEDLQGAVGYLNNQFKNFMPTQDEFNKAVEKFQNSGMMGMGGDKAKKLFDKTFESLVYEPEPPSENQPELTYDNLVAFSKEYFQPVNMIISVVSPASPDSINALFSSFKGNPVAEEPPVYSRGLILTSKDTTFEKDLQGERSYLFWGFTTQIDPKDAPALQALSLILADDIIFDIREKQGMAYNMSAGIDVNHDKALFYISQGTRPQNVDTLVSQYPKFFASAAVDTLTQDQLQKSVNMYLGRMMFRRLSSINKAYYLAHSVYFNNDFNYDKQFLEELKNVKLADVKEAAKKYMHAKNPVLIIVR
jgi:predicted Zn-dependent peptidase